MEHYIRIYKKTATKINTSMCVVTSGNVCQRTLEHRGIHYWDFICRSAKDQEIVTIEKSWREMIYSYESISLLIKDEFEITKDGKWCRAIINFLKYNL